MNDSEFRPFTPEDVVILAEDEMFSRFMTHEIFKQLGNPKLVAAKDGIEAEAALRAADANLKLVVLDFQMPGRNGLQILRDLRRGLLGVRRDMPVMMISAIASSGLVAAAAALDIDGFAVKPATPDVVRGILETIFKRPALASTVKTGEVYDAVDIDTICQMISRPEDVAGEADPISINDLKEGKILASDIAAPGGALLVTKGTRVTARLICLLRGLAAGGLPLDPLWIKRA
jgi:CheY-like chemotaxis protein